MTTAVAIHEQGQETGRSPFLSHSQLNRYVVCPEQYRLHYIEQYRARFPAGGLVFGQALHQALAGLFGNGLDPVPIFRDVWASIRDLDLSYSRKDSWDKLAQAGEALLRGFLEEAAPRITNVAAVERRFELRVTGLPLPLVGYIDLVADLDGTRTVIDFKTATSGQDGHEVTLSDQLTAYLLAEPEAKQAAHCVLVRTREPRVEWHVTKRDPQGFTEFLSKVAHVADEMAQARFYKRAGLWCSWCDFLPVCVGDRATVEETLIRIR